MCRGSGLIAFAIPALYRVLEKEGFQYTIRIPANDVLMANISSSPPLDVQRPLNRHDMSWYHGRLATWTRTGSGHFGNVGRIEWVARVGWPVVI